MRIQRRLWLAALLLVTTAPTLACDAEHSDPWVSGQESALLGDEFYGGLGDDEMYYIQLNWPHDSDPRPTGSYAVHPDASMEIHRIHANTNEYCPDVSGDPIWRTANDGRDGKQPIAMRLSGNMTLNTPKPSYKFSFRRKSERPFGLRKLNLKSMWNDVSQMRESLAWSLFDSRSVVNDAHPASRHVFARFCINGSYKGLYSVIEQVDEAFLKRRFDVDDADNHKGNLYKAAWHDIGPADLTYRGDDGSDYFRDSDNGERSYQLKTNEDGCEDGERQDHCYDDLAHFIRVINGRTVDYRFESAEYREAVEDVFEVESFLRWAAINNMIGAWDNYWRTPANYYLYNQNGSDDADNGSSPYFHFIPWDYDNSFGSDFFRHPWQRVSVLDWEGATAPVNESRLPLITNLLKNQVFRDYYARQVRGLIEDELSNDNVQRSLDSIQSTIRASAYREGTRGMDCSVRGDTAPEPCSQYANYGAHTGRQFTNAQVYWNGYMGYGLRKFGNTWLPMDDNQMEQCDGTSACILPIQYFMQQRRRAARDELRGARLWDLN